MLAIRTVLCPVDFSDATPRQVALAADLASLCDARLILHHNLPALAPGAGVGWMWSTDHAPITQESVAARLSDLAAAHVPGPAIELRITEGPASSAVLAVGDALDADVLVLSTHQLRSDDHESVTGTVLHKTHRSMLVLHDARFDVNAVQLSRKAGATQVVLVPTDFTPQSRAAVAFAFELAGTMPLELHLLHLVRAHEATHAVADERLRALVPAGFGGQVCVHVREGDASRGIIDAATELRATCIVMGEHAPTGLRRWFSRDTSLGVLYDAPCPVWYVPAMSASHVMQGERRAAVATA